MNVENLTSEENDLHYNMRFLCRELNTINKKLPKKEQLPQVLFNWIGNSIFWWYDGFIDEHSPIFKHQNYEINKFEEWSIESGYIDFDLIKDFITKHKNPSDVVDNMDDKPLISDVIDAYEAWVLGKYI